MERGPKDEGQSREDLAQFRKTLERNEHVPNTPGTNQEVWDLDLSKTREQRAQEAHASSETIKVLRIRASHFAFWFGLFWSLGALAMILMSITGAVEIDPIVMASMLGAGGFLGAKSVME